MAVRIGGPDHWPASVAHRFLGRERLVFCASPDYIEIHGMPESTTDLVKHDAVLYGKADGTTSPWLIEHGDGVIEQRTMEGHIIVGNGEAQVAAVQAGCGVAQLATWLVRDEIECGNLVQILPELATDGLPLNLVWPVGRQLLTKVDAILELMAEKLTIN